MMIDDFFEVESMIKLLGHSPVLACVNSRQHYFRRINNDVTETTQVCKIDRFYYNKLCTCTTIEYEHDREAMILLSVLIDK